MAQNAQTPDRTFFYAFLIAIVLGLALLTSHTLGQSAVTVYRNDGDRGLHPDFWTALYALATLSVLVERAVEVVLNTAGLQPEPILDTERNIYVKSGNARPIAGKIALGLGIVLAASGVRILETLVEIVQCQTGGTGPCVPQPASYLFRFSDIAISAGIMAGSADMLHPYINAIVQFGVRIKDAAAGVAPRGDTLPVINDPLRFQELSVRGPAKADLAQQDPIV